LQVTKEAKTIKKIKKLKKKISRKSQKIYYVDLVCMYLELLISCKKIMKIACYIQESVMNF